MLEKQPNEIRRSTTAPVSQLITQATEALRAGGAVDWKCEGCGSAGMLPYGPHAEMIRAVHQRQADTAKSGENYAQGPPWTPCGITLPSCVNCVGKGANHGPSPTANATAVN